MNVIYGPESCGDGDPIPGVAAPMNSPWGIQRCDVCALYPDDESAARALAEVMVPGGVVERLNGESSDYCITVDGQPVDLEALFRQSLEGAR